MEEGTSVPTDSWVLKIKPQKPTSATERLKTFDIFDDSFPTGCYYTIISLVNIGLSSELNLKNDSAENRCVFKHLLYLSWNLWFIFSRQYWLKDLKWIVICQTVKLKVNSAQKLSGSSCDFKTTTKLISIFIRLVAGWNKAH